MFYEVKSNGLSTIEKDGQEIVCRTFSVNIPAVDDGVTGVGMVSRTTGAKVIATFDSYAVDLSSGVPTVKTEEKCVEFDGNPAEITMDESISKAYPTHGPISYRKVEGKTIGIPKGLFEALAVKVIRPASQQ
nr:MAG TPA: hypothetical protein [Caudoviricetes sp.]